MFEWVDILGMIAGAAGGLIAGRKWGSGKKGEVIRILVDTINQVGDVIGERNQKEVKKAVRRNSLREGMQDVVHNAVKKVEDRAK